MSFRRSLSFKEHEKELLDFYDDNGQSEIAKTAMKFYKKNKDKIIIDDIKDIVSIISTSVREPIHQTANDMRVKTNKLIK